MSSISLTYIHTYIYHTVNTIILVYILRNRQEIPRGEMTTAIVSNMLKVYIHSITFCLHIMYIHVHGIYTVHLYIICTVRTMYSTCTYIYIRTYIDQTAWLVSSQTNTISTSEPSLLFSSQLQKAKTFLSEDLYSGNEDTTVYTYVCLRSTVFT